jgi:hypothetical protein
MRGSSSAQTAGWHGRDLNWAGDHNQRTLNSVFFRACFSFGNWIQTLRKKLKQIPNLTLSFDTSAASLSQNVIQLKHIPDATERTAVIHAYARSISMIWIVVTPILGAGFIMSAYN